MIRKLLGSTFINAGFWIFLASGVINAGNYFYHVVTARLLGPVQYGVLESAISVLYFLYIPLLTLAIVVVKFTSEYKGKQRAELATSFYDYMKGYMFRIGAILSVLILLLSPLILSFLHLSSFSFIVLLILAFSINMLAVLNKSALQGIGSFPGFAASNIIETLGKIIFAVVLVLIGLQAEGALAAIPISAVLGYFVSLHFIRLRKQVNDAFPKEERVRVIRFAIPVLLFNIGITSLFTVDIILVRHLFSGVESGYYSALSVLGKIIFFALSPVALTMFPLISEQHARGEKSKKYFFAASALTIIGSIVITLIYFSFPELVVGLLFGKDFLIIAPLVGMFGLFISIYTIASLFANFYLSIHKVTPVYFVIAAAILQIVLVSLFHDSLLQVIHMSIVSVFLLLISLLLYFPYASNR